ncbi:MAG: 6,7-dimethyl-8-ribityllumazine synthase [Dehalococcoidia bacterium]
MGQTFQGELHGEGLRLALVVSRFNESITSKLLAGAQKALGRYGVRDDDIDIVWVPGAFELPFAALVLAESRRYDAIVCLGAIIRGETAHFEFVAGEASRGIARVGLDTGVPTVFGVVTPDSIEQALDRADGSRGNKGFDAAVTAIEMVSLTRQLRPD